jgi:hypothetical protein
LANTGVKAANIAISAGIIPSSIAGRRSLLIAEGEALVQRALAVSDADPPASSVRSASA